MNRENWEKLHERGECQSKAKVKERDGEVTTNEPYLTSIRIGLQNLGQELLETIGVRIVE